MRNLELEIENLDHYGRGIARNNGIITFVENALPSEKVEAIITHEKSKLMEGKSTKILNSSVDRVVPKCPYYSECGGCNIMHLSYPQQLKFKENKVNEILKKFADFDNVKKIVESSEYNYRNKITLQVKNVVGYYKNKTYELIPINKCLIADDRINNIIPNLNKLNLENINQIVIRYTTNECMLVFYVRKNINIDLKLFEDIDTIVVINEKEKIIKGKGYILEELGDLKFIISPTSFFQVNTKGMLNLYNKVLEYSNLNGNENLLDLYCGTGTIGLYLARNCGKVLGIEINEEAVKDALKNKEINNINNIDFKAGDVKEILKNNNFIPDIIVVDPPRAGLDRMVIDELLSLNPNKIVYVSCDPVTLARDIKLLSENYSIIECTPVDMFPNTYHVENVCVMELR